MKFRIRIMLCMVALMALLFGIGGSTMIFISFQKSYRHECETAGSSYRLLVRTLQLLGDVDGWTDGADVADSLRELVTDADTVWRACRLSSDEKVYYSQGGLDDLFKDSLNSTDMGYFTESQVQSDTGYYLQLSGMLKVGEETLFLDMLCDITSIYETRAQQEQAFYRIFLVLLLSCLALAGLISWLLTRPLSRLSRAANEIASGNLSFRSGVESPDEIGILARDFDHMAGQMEQSMEKIRDSMKRQEEFMGNFAHELKTPMTSVIGYADLIRSRALSEEETAEAADYIFSEGKRLENLSLKLLDIFLADRGSIAFQSVSPQKLIRECAASLEKVYQEDFGIFILTDTEPGFCMLEPDLFRTLLLNLADNARKAIDGEGTVILGCRMEDDGCTVWCRDDGRGIPQEARDHLTEAFYRVDRSRSREQGGAGLGLTLCNKIAKIHVGSLSIESEVGQGTVVSVRLRGEPK